MSIARFFTKRKIFVVLCVISLIFISPIGGALTFLGAFLVVTWPLVVIMFAAPSLVILWVLTLIIRALFAKTKLGPNLWLSIPLALLLMAIPPYWGDQASRDKVTALLASDLDRLDPPENIETLGLIVFPNWREDDPNICGELCLRLLLNGEVGRVIISTPPTSGREINWQQSGSAYSLQINAGCRNAATGYNGLSIDVSGRRSTVDRDEVDAALIAQQSTGNCLTKSQMKIGAADAVIFYAPVADGQDIYDAGLTYSANTAKATRLAYFQNTSTGMELMYQKTVASYTRHFPIIAFSQNLEFGGTAASRLGFLGWEIYQGEGSERWLTIDAMPFLRSRLGLNLEISQLDNSQIAMQGIPRALESAGHISPTITALITSFISNVAQARVPSAQQADLAIQIWEDPRIQLSNRTAMAVRAISNALPELEPRMAETLFSRLENVESNYNTPAFRTRQRLYATTALSELGRSALAPYFDQIASLSARNDIGTTALPLVARLGDFGAAGVPPLLALLDSAGLQPDGRRIQTSANWERRYEAAISGLCHVAFSGDTNLDKEDVRAQLESRLKSGAIISRAGASSTLGMLVAFGMDQESLGPYFQRNNLSSALFQRMIEAATLRPGCPTEAHR